MMKKHKEAGKGIKRACILLFTAILAACPAIAAKETDNAGKTGAQLKDGQVPAAEAALSADKRGMSLVAGGSTAAVGQASGEAASGLDEFGDGGQNKAAGRTGTKENKQAAGGKAIPKDDGQVEKGNAMEGKAAEGGDAPKIVSEEGMTVAERFAAPPGFERVRVEDGSFGQYLRNLPLKPAGSKVHYYDGGIKPLDVHAAVLDIDVGGRDLQQCADAVIRLRAEYLYAKGLYEKIHFNFTNGFKADFASWMQGKRILVEGNEARWVKTAGYSGDYKSFRKYLDMVFAYAGTLSLSKEMEKIPVKEIQPGDVFLEGGTPGHAAIVLDVAENKGAGGKLFILAQSYMPAQDIHILKNPGDGGISPWYSLDFGDVLQTPEWQFDREQLYRFAEGVVVHGH